MHARQAVLVEPFKVEVREVDLPAPASNQILVQTAWSAVSAGTELAVYTGTHQWLKDPSLPDWKFPFRPGYSAAGTVVAAGAEIQGWKPGDRVSYPGNHASHELLTIGHERGRLWKLPGNLEFETACIACIARYGFGRIGPRRADAWPIVRGVGPGHHWTVCTSLRAGCRLFPGRRNRRSGDAP